MKYLYLVLRILLGLVFIFSGYVKAVDPWGTAIKFDEYFEAMGLEALQSLSFLLSNILTVLELLVGYLLASNTQMRWASRTAFLLMLIFTPLTLWLAITQKVTDCGCFGDAIKLTDWETFYKNVVLILITFGVLISTNKFPSSCTMKKQRLLFIIGLLFSAGIVYYSYQHLPLIDFRPYKIGSDIQKGMEIPENAPSDVYETSLKYEKNGVVKEFTEKNYPWQDTTWHYVSSEQRLIKKGYTPPIHDFVIETTDGEDVTQSVLSDENCLLLVSYKLEETNFVKKYRESPLRNILATANKKNISVYLLTSSMYEQIENMQTYIKDGITYCLADEKMLKTMIRANPGVVLLSKGIVVGKWNINDLPQQLDFKKYTALKNDKKFTKNAHSKQLYLSVLLFVILAVITFIIKSNWKRKNNIKI